MLSEREIRQYLTYARDRELNAIGEHQATLGHINTAIGGLTDRIEAEPADPEPPEEPPAEEPNPDPEDEVPGEEPPPEAETELEPPHVYVQPAAPLPPLHGYPDNRPDGFETLLNINGTSKLFDHPGWFYGAKYLADHRVRVVEDPAAKHGFAIEKRWYADDDSGWQGLASLNGDLVPAYREVFIRKVFALSPNYQSHGAGEKIIISTCGVGVYTPPGNPLTLGIVFGQFMAPSGDLTPAYASWIPIYPDAPDLSGMPAHELQASQWCPRLELGRYTTIEVQRRTASSPDPAVRDGFIRFIWDDIEFTRFTMRQPHMPELTRDVSLANVHGLSDPRTFPGEAIQLVTHWGGSHDTKRVDDYERMSEFVWAGKGPV